MKKLFKILIVLMLIILPKKVFAEEQWIEEDDSKYYEVDGVRVTGHQLIDG